MAATYISALFETQPRGPYHLAGWSLGGTIAFEMGRQLVEKGEEVDLIALFDSKAPNCRDPVENIDRLSLLLGFARDMGLPDVAWQALQERIHGKGEDESLGDVVESLKRARILPPEPGVEQVEVLLEVFKTNLLASYRYVAKPSPLSVIMFTAAESLVNPSGSAAKGWNKVAQGGAKVHVVPGNHYSLLKEPNLGTLAKLLTHYLVNDPIAKADTVAERG